MHASALRIFLALLFPTLFVKAVRAELGGRRQKASPDYYGKLSCSSGGSCVL